MTLNMKSDLEKVAWRERLVAKVGRKMFGGKRVEGGMKCTVKACIKGGKRSFCKRDQIERGNVSKVHLSMTAVVYR